MRKIKAVKSLCPSQCKCSRSRGQKGQKYQHLQLPLVKYKHKRAVASMQ